jgi:hypothetical protein
MSPALNELCIVEERLIEPLEEFQWGPHMNSKMICLKNQNMLSQVCFLVVH